MAKDDDLELEDDGAEAEAPKSKSKLIIIIVAAVLFIGISAGATLFLTGMLAGDEEVDSEEMAEGTEADENNKDKKKKAKSKAPINYIPLSPAFVVNFTGDTDIRFLQVTLQAATRDPEIVPLVKEHSPAIRNSLVMLFSGQDPAVLNTREGKEELRAKSLIEVQKVLKEETGSDGVEQILFTSFVMQ